MNGHGLHRRCGAVPPHRAGLPGPDGGRLGSELARHQAHPARLAAAVRARDRRLGRGARPRGRRPGARGAAGGSPDALGRLSMAAALNVFAWMGLSTLAMVWLSVAEGALLVHDTMPLWATLLAWPLRGARPTPRGLAALALGLAGVAVLLGESGLALE